jgi:hypothetical protein
VIFRGSIALLTRAASAMVVALIADVDRLFASRAHHSVSALGAASTAEPPSACALPRSLCSSQVVYTSVATESWFTTGVRGVLIIESARGRAVSTIAARLRRRPLKRTRRQVVVGLRTWPTAEPPPN